MKRSLFVSGGGCLSGSVRPPPSKSQTMRAILFASLAKGNSVINNYLPSPDVDAMISACELAGATIKKNGASLEIFGGDFTSTRGVVNCGNSGQVFRFFGACAALSAHGVALTGDDSIRTNRPSQPLISGIRALGGHAERLQDGSILIKGPIKPGFLSIEGADSQPVSALLIVASQLEGITEIEVKNPGEKPWIAMTLFWLNKMGVQVENNDFQFYRIFGREKPLKRFSYNVPADWSSAAYPIAAALISKCELIIDGIDMQDVQGDRAIIPLLQEMGANFVINGEKITVKPSNLQGTTINLEKAIDAVNILSVVACFAKGETRLYGGAIARKKECDRIAVMAQELTKMGATIKEMDDGLIIQGGGLHGAKLLSHRDHRVAMSLAIAALNAEGDSEIDDIVCIEKSYPNFIKDFSALGANFTAMASV